VCMHADDKRWHSLCSFLLYIRGVPLFNMYVYNCLSMFAKLWKVTAGVVMSVHPRGTALLPLDRFSWNMIFFVYFSKIFQENTNFIKIWWYSVLYLKTDIHFWSYLVQFFSEWEMFQTKVVDKIKTQIFCSLTYFRISYHLWDNV
jgi:hypothetical protein